MEGEEGFALGRLAMLEAETWVPQLIGAAAGTVQAALPAAGPAAAPAEVAWVVARAAQGRGYASEAARSLVTVLRQAGWTVTAHVHPGHHASQQVARAAASRSPAPALPQRRPACRCRERRASPVF